MAITRVTAIWSGFSGAPGYTNLFFEADSAGVANAARIGQVRGFFNTISSQIPDPVTISFEQEVALIDETSGELLGYEQPEEPVESVEGFAPTSSGFSSATGAVITWLTDTVVGNGRVQGRTFIVPISGNSYQSDGTLNSAALTGLRSGAALLAGEAAGLVVWSRPRDGRAGVAAPVNSYRVPDMTAVLRSRRD